MDRVDAVHPKVGFPVAVSLLGALVIAEVFMAASAAVGLVIHGSLLLALAVLLTAAPETLPGSGYIDPADRPATLAAALIPISLMRLTFAVLGTSTWPRTGLILMAAAVGGVSVIAALRSAGLKLGDIGLDMDVRVPEFALVAAALPFGVVLSQALPDDATAISSSSSAIVLLAMLAVMVGAAIDEVIYRGLLQTSISWLGSNFAPLGSGIIYMFGFTAMWSGRWLLLFLAWGVLMGIWREASDSFAGPALASAAFAAGLMAVGPAVL